LPETINILMTGAGAPGAAGIINCLKQDDQFKLVVADADENAVGKFINDEFVRIPLASEPNFIEKVLEVSRERKINIILPLVTKELFHFARHKSKFEAQGIKVLVSSFKSIEIANNKSSCYYFLKQKGIAIPQFFVIKTTEDFIHAAYELGHPQRSFCFKPSQSNGSRGMRIISDSINETEQLFEQKPYNLFITYSHALKILSSGKFPELLVSECLPGDEYSVDCLANHGKCLLAAPRLRKKMVNGISVAGEFVKDETIIQYCSDIIAALELHGNIGIQVKRNEKGEALLLEINPRVQGTIVAGLGAGINLPLLAVKQELGMEIKPEELTVKWGTRFARHWTEVYY
jgi:carbamoyl-phosphate synthase large subunit